MSIPHGSLDSQDHMVYCDPANQLSFPANAASRERPLMLGGNDTHLVSVLAEERLDVWNFSYHGSAIP